MLHKHSKIEIPDSDIFRNDALNRKETIENLTILALGTKEPFVLSVDGKWGSGKTTFIRLWRAYLEKEHKLKTIYFNAWESDFTTDPLIAILGEISAFLEDNLPKNPDSSKLRIVRDLKKTGLKIIKKAAPAMLGGMTAGLLDIDQGFEKAAAAMSDETARKLIERYAKDRSIKEDFENSLKNALVLLPEDKPLIIFIDELDRCRPIYAIQLLERIKHFFGVERIIFVLSIDKVQLGESIKSQYGAIDTDNYLRRFIDLQFMLPEPDIEKFCDYLYQHYDIEQILTKKEIQVDNDKSSPAHFLSFIKEYSKAFELSLREIEQLFLKLDIIFKTLEKKTFDVFFRLFAFFEIFRMKEPRLYLGVMRNDSQSKDEAKQLMAARLANFTSKSPYKDRLLFANLVIDAAGLSEEEFNQLRKKVIKELKKTDPNNQEERSRKEFCKNFLQHAPDKYQEMELYKQIGYVHKRLEFLDRFSV